MGGPDDAMLQMAVRYSASRCGGDRYVMVDPWIIIGRFVRDDSGDLRISQCDLRRAQGLELKDVVNLAFHKFFERQQYLPARGVMPDGPLPGGARMKPRKQPTSRNVPRIDWPNLTDEALEELRTLVEAERQRRWFARRPRSPVDDLHDSGRAPQPAHAEAFDTYHCRTHGTRYLSRGELGQEERDETCVYVCTLCGQVADPTPLF